MGKIRVGSMKQKTLVEGDANLIEPGEVLITNDEGYTVIRERNECGELKTSVVIPLEEFEGNGKKKNR